MTSPASPAFLLPTDTFARRHIGPNEGDVKAMLQTLGLKSLDELVAQTIPADIRLNRALAPMTANEPRGEHELLAEFQASCRKNEVFRSFIGTGYSGTIVPPVIQRNILENPGWYTQYTPYQAEIAQGRLEALLNFQTMISDLTGLPMAGASLLDEATAAAEAVSMCYEIGRGKRHTFFVSDRCHSQVIAVVQTRADAIGIKIVVGVMDRFDFASGDIFGALLPYPCSDGQVVDLEPLVAKIHAAGALAVVDADLLALTLLRAPGEFGADIAIGSAQRFGVPFGFGGPHAAFLSTKSDYKREMPGRLIGVSRDAHGNRALRMALQTREQHIRREKATSNICTAQVLLAVMAGMYGVYHGPAGLKAIALRVHGMTKTLAKGLEKLGFKLEHANVFDSLAVNVDDSAALLAKARTKRINLRALSAKRVGISLDETTDARDVAAILEAFGGKLSVDELAAQASLAIAAPHARKSAYMTHPVFNTHHSEHEMLRYMRGLEARDLSLTHSMIPLGSCTMKLNATSEMVPVTWAEVGGIHPFAPAEQTRGYQELFANLERALLEITGFHGVSLQPNAGSQGEYAGLLVIRAYHESRGEGHRNVCLIPTSAHGTNPASAVMAGMQVVVVACDAKGNVDVADLRAKAKEHAAKLSCLMITYPSTHGVFEESIREICPPRNHWCPFRPVKCADS